MNRLLQAGRRRLDRMRSGTASEDAGFVLVYVLLVSMMITLAVTSMMVVTASNIIPAKNSQNSQSAYAAAEAGVQDAVAYLNTQCPSTDVHCTYASVTEDNNRTGTDVLAGSGESFQWKILGTVTSGNSSYLRVKSTGSDGGQSKTLVADIKGVDGVLDYEYYSTYETLSTEQLNAYYTNRSIDLTNSAVCGAVNVAAVTCSNASPATAKWNGASASSPSDSVCDKLWYNSPLNGSSSTGRATLEEGLPGGADYAETGSVAGNSVTRYAPCQVAFTSGMAFDGPVYTVDAPLISDGVPGGAGPDFQSTVNTAYAPTSGLPYRQDPYVGGTVSNPPTSQPNPKTFSSTFNPTVPGDACIYYGPTRVYLNGDGTATITSPQTNSSIPTSSLSTDRSCYPSNPLPSTGIIQFTLNYKTSGHGIIYIKNNNKPTGGFATTGQKSTTTASPADTAFYLTSAAGSATADQGGSQAPDSSCSNTAPVNKYSATALSTCAWSQVAATGDGPGWATYTTAAKCGSTPATDRQTFECDLNHQQNGSQAPGNNQYGIFRSRVQIDLSRSQCLSGSLATQSACIAGEISGELQTANSGQRVANAPGASPGDHQYVVTATTPSTTVVTGASKSIGSTAAAPTSDPLFVSSAGSAGTETPSGTAMTFDVKRQTYGCYVPESGGLSGVLQGILSSLGLSAKPGSYDATGKLCGQVCFLLLCSQGPGTDTWGDAGLSADSINQSTPQFEVTDTQYAWAVTKSPTSGVSYFPNMNDVTQYTTGTNGANGSNGPGDAYIEGTNTAPLSVLTDNDAVVTGKVKASGSAAAMDIDSLGSVRVYHPVQCADQTATDINATYVGFCPNDITGLYTGGLTSGTTLNPSHPANQYSNMTSAIGEIDAALISQGGSVLTDNFDRGASMSGLTVKGGLYQLHRGALGVQWELLSTADKRASSGYSLSMSYVNQQDSPYIPAFSGGSTSRYWNVVSVSSAAS